MFVNRPAGNNVAASLHIVERFAARNCLHSKPFHFFWFIHFQFRFFHYLRCVHRVEEDVAAWAAVHQGNSGQVLLHDQIGKVTVASQSQFLQRDSCLLTKANKISGEVTPVKFPFQFSVDNVGSVVSVKSCQLITF